MNVLLFSTLFPNAEQPLHALFVEQRLRHLIRAYPGLRVKVVAPVPWFPFTHERFGQYGRFARVSRYEKRGEVEVYHPRYPVIPKLGMSLAPLLMALGAFFQLRKIRRAGFDFDLIDAHFLYPDGIAATFLGKWLKRPVVITARGSDVMLHQNYRIPRWITKTRLASAHTLICVAAALRNHLQTLGFKLPVTRILRNGVDLQLFAEQAREQTRQALGLQGSVLISVGRLAQLKGLDLVIAALAEIPDATLLLVGEGPEESNLRQWAEKLGVAGRVRFLGGKEPGELAKYFSAADIKVLASSREGWPNVLLESMACGTPVVATAVGGVPEVLGEGAPAVLVHDRSAAGLVAGITGLLADYPARSSVRSYAEKFDWSETSSGQYEVFQRAIEDFVR